MWKNQDLYVNKPKIIIIIIIINIIIIKIEP